MYVHPDVEHAFNNLPREEFFLDQNSPQDYQSGLRYIDTLERRRIAALAKPLWETLPHVLDTKAIWQLSCSNEDDRHPEMAYRFQTFNRNQLLIAQPDDVSIILQKSLRAKVDTHSQVYKAVMTVRKSAPRNVCVKIFQQSLCKLPDPEYFDEDAAWPALWRSARQDAAVEAWAYRKLVSLQGAWIPHSLGFYKIRMPGGEVAVAHVLEYLDGMVMSNLTGDIVAQRLGPNYGIFDMATVLEERLYHMQSLGVMHGDLLPRNLMLLRQSPNQDPWSALLILDFDCARATECYDSNCDIVHPLMLLQHLGASADVIERWFRQHASSNPPPKWIPLFGNEKYDDAHFRFWRSNAHRDEHRRGLREKKDVKRVADM
ncbi:hypothetical protein PUNSTDRAFT_138680 [Punctularia strigosozonata HHB-11173 SS5]|uniref:Protein kinase domain-containing protein n=1 Tax=Punctularia strigosozonata (strain HHB-11173) TaxID=741275 RepID=R7S1N0_PUNST|nr:uncharacterized protein PUNSTDRAFT_138680 [Punctularia strigosozonata HHB-11173 SS5]EIN04285.1 hypothetical protein PUNSTDRAFT_138680 [Punctularia strigosozonata HHB-11173 SS5]